MQSLNESVHVKHSEQRRRRSKRHVRSQPGTQTESPDSGEFIAALPPPPPNHALDTRAEIFAQRLTIRASHMSEEVTMVEVQLLKILWFEEVCAIWCGFV